MNWIIKGVIGLILGSLVDAYVVNALEAKGYSPHTAKTVGAVAGALI